jgi:hypothetical protein
VGPEETAGDGTPKKLPGDSDDSSSSPESGERNKTGPYRAWIAKNGFKFNNIPKVEKDKYNASKLAKNAEWTELIELSTSMDVVGPDALKEPPPPPAPQMVAEVELRDFGEGPDASGRRARAMATARNAEKRAHDSEIRKKIGGFAASTPPLLAQLQKIVGEPGEDTGRFCWIPAGRRTFDLFAGSRESVIPEEATIQAFASDDRERAPRLIKNEEREWETKCLMATEDEGLRLGYKGHAGKKDKTCNCAFFCTCDECGLGDNRGIKVIHDRLLDGVCAQSYSVVKGRNLIMMVKPTKLWVYCPDEEGSVNEPGDEVPEPEESDAEDDTKWVEGIAVAAGLGEHGEEEVVAIAKDLIERGDDCVEYGKEEEIWKWVPEGRNRNTALCYHVGDISLQSGKEHVGMLEMTQVPKNEEPFPRDRS